MRQGKTRCQMNYDRRSAGWNPYGCCEHPGAGTFLGRVFTMHGGTSVFVPIVSWVVEEVNVAGC